MPTNFHYGGQAVIEGVMIRGPQQIAVAVRKSNGEVILDKRVVKSLSQRYSFLKLPMLRGILALIEALVLGVQVLTYSANQACDEEEEALSYWQIFLTVAISLLFGVLLFIILPAGVVYFLKGLALFWQNLLEGILRLIVFLGYILAISRIDDIQRVFQYHGAEHKVIHAFEADEEITVENCRKYSTLHPRCGTSFLFIVLFLSLAIFSFLNTPNLWWHIFSRVLLMPWVAAIGYEVIKFSAKYTHMKTVNWAIKPGLWLQKLTTKEPDDQQLEVAIKALDAARAV